MRKLAFLLMVLLAGCTVTEEKYNVDLTLRPYPITAGVETNIDFKITDDSGNPVPLETMHERIVHLFTIREDLEEFKHIHPEDFGKLTEENMKDAAFSIKNTFSEAGKYAVVFEFTTNGKTLYKQLELNVEGAKKELSVNRDTGRIKSFSEYGMEMIPVESLDGQLVEKHGDIKSGEKTNLVFRVIKNGDFVDNLELYLGSEAHFAVWKDDLTNFMHAHAYMPEMDHGQMYFGPNLPVQLTFPEPGFYKIFIQFKHEGKVITGDFMIEVA